MQEGFLCADRITFHIFKLNINLTVVLHFLRLSFSCQGAGGEASPNHSIKIARQGPGVNRENRTEWVGKPPIDETAV